METILNFLPLTENERDKFAAATPNAVHLFRPVDSMLPKARTGTDEDYARATVILGCAPPEQVANAPRLKWLQTWSAGVDPYLQQGVLPESAMLTSAVGAYGQAVSEHMFATLLSLYKRLHLYRNFQREHRWEELGEVKTLVNATVLIAGTGDIGSAFARLVKAMGAQTVGLRRDASKCAEGIDEMYPLSMLDDWLPKADVVALILPHAPETTGLMDACRIATMKADAVLLNGGRGTAVDNTALAQAMARGHLWGAGLDVTTPEPLPADHPLWTVPNCIITPHVAGGEHLAATRERIVSIALDNLHHYLAGGPLKNRIK